jgi:hypothetical protein
MKPPLLTRRLLLARLRKALPQFPGELLKAGIEEIAALLAAGIQSGRPIVLRGFGRLTPRRYPGGRKKRGLIFRASPALIKRLK